MSNITNTKMHLKSTDLHQNTFTKVVDFLYPEYDLDLSQNCNNF